MSVKLLRQDSQICPQRCAAFDGMPKASAAPLFTSLYFCQMHIRYEMFHTLKYQHCVSGSLLKFLNQQLGFVHVSGVSECTHTTDRLLAIV